MYNPQPIDYYENFPKGEEERIEFKTKLQNSFPLFTRVMFKLRTGKEFVLPVPLGRKCHVLEMMELLTKIYNKEIFRAVILSPPRSFKTETFISFVAWAYCKNPKCDFIYSSYNHSLAKKQTQTIKQIISLPEYEYLFRVKISKHSRAKDNFEIENGGATYGVGAGGTITGRGCGVFLSKEFSGGLIGDDLHKPDEVASKIKRERIHDWQDNTASTRLNDNDRTMMLFAGQKTHSDDILSRIQKTNKEFTVLSIPALDQHNNSFNPLQHSVESLLKRKERQPYVFALQFQQEDAPDEGALIKEDWFEIKDEDPEIVFSFVTVDTAETEKTYNDATVFSFFGIYKIKNEISHDSNKYALHWIDCIQIWVEPKDLQNEFLKFYSSCCRYKTPPEGIYIEKKSTGTTLLSTLKEMQGIKAIEILRDNRKSKMDRFISMQEYLTRRLVSFNKYAKHKNMCIDHCKKITVDNTHRLDDIADTLYDAIDMTFISKTITNKFTIKEIKPLYTNKDLTKKPYQYKII